MPLSLWLWNLSGIALCGWQEAIKLLESSLGSEKARSDPAGKEENLQHDIRYLLTNSRANGVAIFDSVITRYLITLTKVGWSTFALQFLSTFNCISSALLVSLLFIIYLLFVTLLVVSYLHSSIVLDHFEFASVSDLFVLFHLIICYLITWCYFLFWYWMYFRHFDPHNNHPTSQ